MICAIVDCRGNPIRAADGTIAATGAPRPAGEGESAIVERLCFWHLVRRPLSAHLAPDVDTAIALTRAHFETTEEHVNLKENTKQGTCEAMRCKDPAAHYVTGWNRSGVGLCQRHFGQAIADGDTTIDGGAGGALVHAPPSASPSYEIEVEAAAREGAETLEAARVFVITTDDDYQIAAEILAEAKGRAKDLEAREKAITGPINAGLKRIRDMFRPARTAFAEVESVLKAAIARFAAEQEARNAAAMATAQAAIADGDGAAAGAALAQVSNARNVSGLTVRPVWRFEIVDAEAVDRLLCSPDERKIGWYVQTFDGERPADVPGVRFFEDHIVSSRSAS